MIHYCTYFDQNYLTRGLALYRSLVRHSPEFTLWVLALDDSASKTLRQLALPGVEVVDLEDLERADPQLRAVRDSRSRIEYYFTCTPSWPRFLLGSHPEIDLMSYLDADLLFYSDPTPVFDELGEDSVLIIPHRFPPQLAHLAVHGTFNVGMVSFRNDVRGMSVLSSWRTECIDWCYDELVDGKFADQGYLNAWPQKPGVHVLTHLGAGLGPWNAMRYEFDLSRQPPTVDGWPIVFYHFQGMKPIGAGLWNLGLEGYGRLASAPRKWLYGHYIDELRESEQLLQRRLAVPPRTRRGIRHSGPGLRDLLRFVKGGYVMFKP